MERVVKPLVWIKGTVPWISTARVMNLLSYSIREWHGRNLKGDKTVEYLLSIPAGSNKITMYPSWEEATQAAQDHAEKIMQELLDNYFYRVKVDAE